MGQDEDEKRAFTDEETKAELFQCWLRGWKDGTRGMLMRLNFIEHRRTDIAQAYRRGYNKGRDETTLAAIEECERLGYDAQMSILRKEPIEEPPR
jgi:hypothetical protein